MCSSVLQCAAVCCSVLQGGAVVQHGRVLLDRAIRVVHQKSLEIHQKSPTFYPKRPKVYLRKGECQIEKTQKPVENIWKFDTKHSDIQHLGAVLDTGAQRGATGTPTEILSRTGTSLNMQPAVGKAQKMTGLITSDTRCRESLSA